MSPVLIAQIAFTVPGYFAEDTPGEAVTTLYDTRVDATTPTATSPQGVDAPSGRAEGPGSTAEVPGTTAGVPGNAAEGSDRPMNHGQVMKQLQELTDGPAPGCLTSAVAQSDLGKGKQRDQSDGTNTTLASSFADEFDCTSVTAPDGNGSSKVSKDDVTTRPDKPNPSDKSKKDSGKSKNGRGKSDK